MWGLTRSAWWSNPSLLEPSWFGWKEAKYYGPQQNVSSFYISNLQGYFLTITKEIARNEQIAAVYCPDMEKLC